MSSRRPRGRPKKIDPSSDINKTVTEPESQEEVVESSSESSESEATEPVQSVTTSDESTTDSDELLDITPTAELTQSFEYVRRDHVLVCPACNKQAASGLDRQPICSSTQHPACPRRSNNG